MGFLSTLTLVKDQFRLVVKPLNFKSFSIVFLLFIVACGSDDHSAVFQEVVKPGDNKFRSVELGASVEDVKKAEVYAPEDEDEDYLYYSYNLEDQNSYAVSYSFSKHGLYEIQVDIYLNETEDASTFFKEFKSYFDDLYGTSENSDGSCIWLTESDRSKEIEVTLIDDSETYGYGKLSISLYDFDN